MDVLLQKFFEASRWEKALETGVGKGIDKGELRRLTCPEVRAAMYNCIISDQYEIAPAHIAMIPKDKPGEFREVHINENVDRIFLSIVNDMFFEMFPHYIHPSCKSYQKNIGCGKVVQQVSKRICDSKTDSNGVMAWKSDLSKYFDSVPRQYIDAVFDRIENEVGKSKIIDIVRKYYHTDLLFDADGNLIERYGSLKQGCALASFLSDVMLYHIDEMLSNLKGLYVRYSDDCLYVGEDYEDAMHIMKTELDKMHLTLNPKKVEYLTYDKWFKFLGFHIKGNQITLSKGRVNDFQNEIASRTTGLRNVSLTKATNSVNRYLYKGDGTYSWATSVLPIINVQKDIDKLNEYVMDSLRACATGKKKIGGLGVVMDRDDYTILRGTGKNVKANRMKTQKEIPNYMSIRCMQNALLCNRAVYDTLVRSM